MITADDRPGVFSRWGMRCPCGLQVVGGSQAELVRAAFDHLRALHPEMVDRYDDSDVLSLAHRLPPSPKETTAP